MCPFEAVEAAIALSGARRLMAELEVVISGVAGGLEATLDLGDGGGNCAALKTKADIRRVNGEQNNWALTNSLASLAC